MRNMLRFRSGIFSARRKGLETSTPCREGEEPICSGRVEGGRPRGIRRGYRLMGTILGPEISLGYPARQGKPQTGIHRSREPLNGGKIVEISRNQVSIERDGRTEILTTTEGAETIPPRPAPRAAAPPSKGKWSTNCRPTGSWSTARIDGRRGNINQFMTQARLKPHFDQGRPVGYSVTEIKPGGLIEKLGLKNSDIVKKVNGMVVTRPEDVMQAYTSFSGIPISSWRLNEAAGWKFCNMRSDEKA